MRLIFLSLFFLLFASAQAQTVEPDSLQRPDLTGSFESAPGNHRGRALAPGINKALAPRVFSGYRHINRPSRFTSFPDPEISRQVWRDSVLSRPATPDSLDADPIADLLLDSVLVAMGLVELPDYVAPDIIEEDIIPSREDLPIAFGSVIPDWLRQSADTYRLQEDFVYSMMIENPSLIEYAYWELPERPTLPEEDFSLRGYLRRLNLPEINNPESVDAAADLDRINWLHVCNIALQLSQAYVSGNWYQGGNSYLAFLGNFLWDVQLNNVYHPNVIFQSTVSYKLAINSTPDDQFHKYSVSQDLFQYNLKTGYKAVHNWYYSFLMQFKTQFLHSYPANSETRTASFLSPGELNLGLGMTYSKENKAKTLKFSASISPISYNLKTCIDPLVEHTQFAIRPDRKWANEIGSNAEVNFFAQIWSNTTYTTKLFLFSDYKTFQADWENTLNFQFSRLFSTQIYAHLRYDTSADANLSRRWGKLMLKEILSVGISYTFSTK